MRARRKVHDRRQNRPLVGMAIWLAFAGSLVGAVGCNSESATVSGTVTLDGKPLTGGQHMNGTVTFSREGGGGAPAVGFIDESGAIPSRLEPPPGWSQETIKWRSQ